MTVRSYRDLLAWQKAMDLADKLYDASDPFPASERFCMTLQLRKAVLSVPSNIAEGHARNSTKEFIHYLSISLGSLAEAETQVILAVRRRYIRKEVMEELLEQSAELGKIIRGLQKSLTKRLKNPAAGP